LKVSLTLKLFTASIILLCSFTGSFGQIFFGVKAGANAAKVSFDSEVYKEFYDTKFKPGFSAGGIFLIENKEKYGLNLEFLYSVKGKSVVSHANDYETNTATYHYLDFPILFRVKFKQPKFNWFLQLGPQVSYWLKGNGAFEVYEPDRDVITTYKYKLNFGEQKNTADYMNVTDANRLQLGLVLGGGFIWELKNANYVSLDLRYNLGHTFLGGFESGSIPNIALVDNFEHTINVLSVSAVYYVDILEKMKLSKNKYRKN